MLGRSLGRPVNAHTNYSYLQMPSRGSNMPVLLRNAAGIARPTVASPRGMRLIERRTGQRLQARLEDVNRFLGEALQHPDEEALSRAKSEFRRISKDVANYDARRVEWAKRYAEQRMEYNRQMAAF